MFILKAHHQAVISGLQHKIDMLTTQRDVLAAETTAERKLRLATTSGLTEEEVSAIIAVTVQRITPDKCELTSRYAERVARSALRLAFTIKQRNVD